MKKTKDELIKAVSEALGENITSDQGIALLEDIKDTFEDSTGGSSDEDKKTIAELQQKLKENDDMWRKKYTDTFLNPVPIPEEKETPSGAGSETEEGEDDEPTTFAELFTTDSK